MDKILVTGGAGFIGSHVVDLLIEQEKEVIVVDNMSTGSYENLNKDVKLEETDITDNLGLNEVFNKHKDINGVVHLAAQSKVGPSVEDPGTDANINIQGTINLLELCRKNNINSFVYASSAAVYGHAEQLPITENAATNPLSPYGVSKLAGEEYVKAYGRLYGINVFALRFANVFGPRQSPHTEAGVISIFIEQLLQGKRPVIFGDGKQTRDFIYVKDIAEAVVNCLTNKDKPAIDNAVYNVSTCSETSVQELLSTLCDITVAENKQQFEEERPGDIKYSYLDNSRLSADFNWKPGVSLKDGLEQTVKYYNNKKK
ncbi:NAD-dependent epimerase/dehydratase family protein [Evansella clarkii]|uniref:NAD-dependent epimerase/dehydratase family protein n=1 Tax=Evansella clarkii TaxID=79879 RepID=UPI00099887CA|nr:NAD-dependent epimerase/dehydratase family protein [Evansella clarkii]